MNTENSALLIGYVGMDANLSQSTSGNKYCRFSIATSNFQKSKEDDKLKKSTDWHDIVCFGRKAEYASKIAKKGALMLIKGRIEKNEWEDGAGNKSSSYSIIAETIKRLVNPPVRDIAAANTEVEDEVEFVEPDVSEIDEDTTEIA